MSLGHNISFTMELEDRSVDVLALGHPKYRATDIESVDLYSITCGEDEYKPTDEEMCEIRERCFEEFQTVQQHDKMFLLMDP